MAFKINKKGILKEYTEEPGVTSVVIPEGVAGIDAYVFRNCKSLQSVTIPESVQKIGDSAFEDCENLTSLTIPESLTDIGWLAFHDCKGLKDSKGFVIVNGIFFGYYGEDEVVEIPCGVTRIAEFAFTDCSHVTKLTIPDSVTVISPNAFDCHQGNPMNIKEIFIPESVTEIGDQAFRGISNVRITIDGKSTKVKCFGGVTDVYENRIYILNRMSLNKLWDEELNLSVLTFAEDYCSGTDIPDSRKKNYVSFLSRARMDYYTLAAKEPKLLQCMLYEKIVKNDEFDTLLESVQKEGNHECISLITEYQNNRGGKK